MEVKEYEGLEIWSNIEYGGEKSLSNIEFVKLSDYEKLLKSKYSLQQVIQRLQVAINSVCLNLIKHTSKKIYSVESMRSDLLKIKSQCNDIRTGLNEVEKAD